MKSPRIPEIASIGANTRTVVIVPEIEAAPTRRMAWPMMAIGSLESSRNASIASVMTMASSTNKPRARITPNSEIVFNEMPTR